jgi:hypothetical protein
MKKRYALLFFISIILFSNACKKDKLKYDTRSFLLGVTPWPPDFTTRGYNLAYNFVNTDCDMVSHHFDDGVPWEEAYNNLPMPQQLIDDLNKRKQKTNSDKKILLSVAPLKLSRKERTGYYGSSPNATYVNSWSNKPFNDTTIVTAYVKFIMYLAEQLHADYINFGVESNSGDWNTSDFDEYKQFLSMVHTRLKAIYPDKPCFISFMVTPDPKFLSNAKQLEPYTDWITISAYPYSYIGSPVHGSSSPALIPNGLFQSFVDINSAKPCAIAETGYIAQDLNLTAVSKEGTVQWQEDYVNYLFDFCQKNHAKFIIWFCAYDYDAAINTFNALGENQELFSLWKDTGLFDEHLAQRPSYSVWKEWLKLPVQ